MLLLNIRITALTLSAAFTGLPGLPRVLWIPLLAVGLQLWERGCHFWIIFLLLLCFVGSQLRENLIRLVGHGVNLVVHQLGETPPITILRYTLHQLIGVLPLRHRTTTRRWTIGVGAMIAVIHITPDLWWLLLYILPITQSHSGHFISQSPIIQFHLRFVVLLHLIPEHCCIVLNAILLLQWPVHREENTRPCDSMLFLSCFKLCPILPIRCFLSTVNNAENLLLLQEYFDFQTAAIVVCTIQLLQWDRCQFGHLRYVSSESVLLQDSVDEAAIQNLNLSQVRQIGKVHGLITCCILTAVLNLSQLT